MMNENARSSTVVLEKTALYTEEAERLAKYIMLLSPTMREAFEYRNVIGYSCNEIANCLIVPEPIISSAMESERKALKIMFNIEMETTFFVDDNRFDELITEALYCAIDIEYPIPSDEELHQIIRPSPRFHRRMKAFLRNPNKYIRRLQRPERPVYVKVLRVAAATLVLLVILFGVVIAVSPAVRAMVMSLIRI